MNLNAPSIRSRLSHILFIISLAVFAWAILIYPLAFEYASQAEHAHAAADSEGGTFMWGIEKMTISGWFTFFTCLAALTSLASVLTFKLRSFWRYAQLTVLTVSLSLSAAHIGIDGPEFVWRSFRLVLLTPDSFSEPIELFIRGILYF